MSMMSTFQQQSLRVVEATGSLSSIETQEIPKASELPFLEGLKLNFEVKAANGLW